LATLGAFSVQFVFSSVMAARSGPFWRSLRPIVPLLAASAVMAFSIGAADRMTNLSDVARLLVFVPSGAVLYGLLALMFGVVPSIYLKSARERLRLERNS